MAIPLLVVMFTEFCFVGWLLASTADNQATMGAVSESVSRFSAVPTETILLDLGCRSICPGLIAYVTMALLGLVLPLIFCGVHLQSCFLLDPRLIRPPPDRLLVVVPDCLGDIAVLSRTVLLGSKTWPLAAGGVDIVFVHVHLVSMAAMIVTCMLPCS